MQTNKLNAKPLLLPADELQAVVDGKTQFREVMEGSFEIKKQDENCFDVIAEKTKDFNLCVSGFFSSEEKASKFIISEYCKHQIGNVYFLKETFNLNGTEWGVAEPLKINYKLDGINKYNWMPSTWMRLEYARFFVVTEDVKVERLQDIEHEDILNEGFPFEYDLKEDKMYSADCHGEVDYIQDCANEWFIEKWNSTHKDGQKWIDNPYVEVATFRLEKR